MVGFFEFGLDEVVTAKDQLLVRDLVCNVRHEGKSGKIKIQAEEKVGKQNEEVFFYL